MMLRPWDVKGPPKKRYGPASGDGGYVILDSAFGARHVLGYGVDKDVTFENQVTEAWGIHAHVFDHTIDVVPHLGPKVTYVKEGLGVADVPPLTSLETHVARYVPEGSDYVLKMDIEGAEWAVLETVDLSRVTQLILEIHDLQEDRSEIIEKINKNFVLVHVHGNNCHNQPWVFIDRTHKMPRYLECTWVRRDLVSDPVPSTAPFPSPLDIKCRGDVPDLPLDFWKTKCPPVSFVLGEESQRPFLEAVLAPEDQIVTDESRAKHDRIFILRPGDIFPYLHICSLHNFPTTTMFPVVYNGAYVLLETRFIFKGSQQVGQTQSEMYNLKALRYSRP